MMPAIVPATLGHLLGHGRAQDGARVDTGYKSRLASARSCGCKGCQSTRLPPTEGYLGFLAHREGRVDIIHRTDMCDWSLFRLGLSLLEHLLNEALPIPVAFNFLEPKSVRY